MYGARIILLLSLILPLFEIQARHPFSATVVVDTDSARVSAPNLVDLNRELRTQSIMDLIPSYTPVSAAGIRFNIRGINAITFFPANSQTLFVSIPQAGIVQAFTGATRNDSLALFKEYLRDGGTKTRLLKAYARYSPIDPIAGNPNSLMAQMGQADYLLGRLSPLSGCGCWQSQPIRHQFQAGAIGERAFSGGFDGTSVSLPLRYSYSPTRSWAFIIDAPFTYINNGGASSVFGSLGLGFRCPMTQRWSLTPVLRIGAGGTLDLCTSGSFFSAGLTSNFDWKVREFVISMTNYAGYITSTNLWLTGVNFNYRLQNYTLKNGLSITSCHGYELCGIPINASLWVIDSYFTRDHLFINHYDEVGINLIGNGINPCLDWDCLTLGFSYGFGEKSYKSYSLNIIYQF